MLRGSRSPDAAYVMMSITPGEGAQLQYRPDSGRPSSSSRFGDPDRTVKAPYWLRLTRSGNLYVGAISADGSVWQEVGSIDLPNLPVLLYGGLAATAVSKNSSGAVKFSNLKIDGLK